MNHRRIHALRVDADNASRVFESLKLGEGRFGWSYVESADLKILQERIQSHGFASLSADEANCYQPFLLLLNPGDFVVYINVPSRGRCALAQVTSPYFWEWRDDDFNHRFRVDPATVRDFDRNDPLLAPNLKARLKLRHRHWRITAEQSFDEFLGQLAGRHSADPGHTLADDAAMACRTHEDESGNSGSSPQSAIDVRSIPDEYAWLARHYPKYQFVKQALCWNVLGWFDVIDIITAAGEERAIHFRLGRSTLHK